MRLFLTDLLLFIEKTVYKFSKVKGVSRNKLPLKLYSYSGIDYVRRPGFKVLSINYDFSSNKFFINKDIDGLFQISIKKDILFEKFNLDSLMETFELYLETYISDIDPVSLINYMTDNETLQTTISYS